MTKLNIRNQASIPTKFLSLKFQYINFWLVLRIWRLISSYCENTDAKSTETMKKKKKKRTQSEHVAGLSLEDLSKYFGVPIVEASRRLHIGLTVLKKKCREFGIPRWPHRKIKSLDTLINDLQVLSLHPSIILSIH